MQGDWRVAAAMALLKCLPTLPVMALDLAYPRPMSIYGVDCERAGWPAAVESLLATVSEAHWDIYYRLPRPEGCSYAKVFADIVRVTTSYDILSRRYVTHLDLGGADRSGAGWLGQ